MSQSPSFSRLVFPMVLLGLSSCSNPMVNETPSHFVRTESTPEAEVRAVFVNIASVSRRKDVDAFKKLIYPADLPDLDAEEREHSGIYESMMASITAHRPKDFRLDLTDSTATFTKEPDSRFGSKTVVVLVRDGTLWKIAKPKKTAASIPHFSSSQKDAPEAGARRRRTQRYASKSS